MSERMRDFLKIQFRDGERPSGSDFGDLIDSFVSKANEGIKVDSDGNVIFTRGLQLGDSDATVPGGLRVKGNQLQVFTGGAWTNVSGGGGGAGAFALPTTAPSPVAHDGSVGIGPFTVAAPPTYGLDVPLGTSGPGTSGTPAEQARFGDLVCFSPPAPFNGFAALSHRQRASNSDCALRQSPLGAVHVNAASGQVISFRQGGTNIRFAVTATGNVVVGGEGELPGAPAGAVFQVAGDVFKFPSNVWGTSDARVKEDVRDLDLGLAALRQVRPVRFRYNGRAGTPAGRADVGVIAQEIETVVPETVRRVNVADDPGLDDMRLFDPAALTYVLINAVKELAAKVEDLEQALAVATAAAADPSPVVA